MADVERRRGDLHGLELMMYATLFVCMLAGTTPCKTVPLAQGYADEAACYKGGWTQAKLYEGFRPAWHVEGVGCSPTPPESKK